MTRRNMGIVDFVDSVVRNIRDGLRSLRGSPGLTAVSVVTLAIGSGAATATFAVIDSVLLEPLPFPEADALVAIWHVAPGAEGEIWADAMLASGSMFFTYAEENRVFEHIGAWTPGVATVTGDGEPEEVPRIAVGGGTLEALGVSPLLGRWFGPEDLGAGAAQTVLLSYDYWQRRFGGDPAVLGHTLTVNAAPATVIGVMPKSFRIADTKADMLLPLRFNRARLVLGNFSFYGIARLKQGTTIADANADIARMIPIWLKSWPARPGTDARTYSDVWRIAPSVRPLKQDVVGKAGELLWLAMAAIGVVLLIAYANVANLMLIRSAERQHELAIRAALGAGVRRLTGVLMLEGTTVGFLGGAAGVALAAAGLHWLLALTPANLPRLSEVGLSARVIATALVVSSLAGLVVGFVAAARVRGARVSEGLHASSRTSSESRGQRRMQRSLVVAQVALVVVVVVCAGLLIRTTVALRAEDPGFARAEQVQTLRISMRTAQVPEPERVTRRQQDIVDALAALPEVRAVGFASSVPMDEFNHLGGTIEIEDRPTDPRRPGAVGRRFKYVSPGFFDAVGTVLLAGRDLSWADLYDGRPVVLVSENLARELWTRIPAALGKRLRVEGDARWREVVGVVGDVREDGLREPPPTIVYLPSLRRVSSPQAAASGQLEVSRSVIIAARSSLAGMEGFSRQMQETVWSVDANLPITSVRTLRDIYEQSMSRTTFAAAMFIVTACAALALGIVGLYGVLSYTVSLRYREIAIRLALGAEQRGIRRRFVRHGLVLAAIGIAIGLVLATGLTRLTSSLLYDVRPIDALTYATAAIGLTLVAAIASYLPARRASAVDPAASLAAE